MNKSCAATINNCDELPIPEEYRTLPAAIPSQEVTSEANAALDDKGCDAGVAQDHPPKNSPKNPQSIVDELRSKGVRFFRNQFDESFAWIPDCSRKHGVSIRLKSAECLARLFPFLDSGDRIDLLHTQLRKAIVLADVLTYDEPRQVLSVRSVWENDTLLIDLCDGEGNVVSISADGWNVPKLDTPKFVRFTHMRKLPVPKSGGDVADIFRYFPEQDSKTRLLLLTWIVSAMCPHIISPILTFVGPPGSAKTTRSLIIRDLVDPSEIPVLGDVKSDDLLLIFRSHANPCFENVGDFNRKNADLFCRAVTGDGIQKRKLFTDTDDVLFKFRRSIILNGINLPSVRSDFLERCLVVECKKLEQFESVQSIHAQFQTHRPKLLGALYSLTSDVLRRLPTANAAPQFRLSDFAQIGRAVARVLGHQEADFDAAYRDRLEYGTSVLRDANPTLNLLKTFSDEYTKANPWEGSASKLLEALIQKGERSGHRTSLRDLPKNPRWLSVRLVELNALLIQEGIIIDRHRTAGVRTIKLYSSKADEEISHLGNVLTRTREGGADDE